MACTADQGGATTEYFAEGVEVPAGVGVPAASVGPEVGVAEPGVSPGEALAAGEGVCPCVPVGVAGDVLPAVAL